MPVFGPVLPLHELSVHAAGQTEPDHDVRRGCGLQVGAQLHERILHIAPPFCRRVGVRPAEALVLGIERRGVEPAERAEDGPSAHALLVGEYGIRMALDKRLVRIEAQREDHPRLGVCGMDAQERIFDAREVERARGGIEVRLVERGGSEQPHAAIEGDHRVAATFAHEPVVREALVLVDGRGDAVEQQDVPPGAAFDGYRRRTYRRHFRQRLCAVGGRRILLVVDAAVERGDAARTDALPQRLERHLLRRRIRDEKVAFDRHVLRADILDRAGLRRERRPRKADLVAAEGDIRSGLQAQRRTIRIDDNVVLEQDVAHEIRIVRARLPRYLLHQHRGEDGMRVGVEARLQKGVVAHDDVRLAEPFAPRERPRVRDDAHGERSGAEEQAILDGQVRGGKQVAMRGIVDGAVAEDDVVGSVRTVEHEERSLQGGGDVTVEKHHVPFGADEPGLEARGAPVGRAQLEQVAGRRPEVADAAIHRDL